MTETHHRVKNNLQVIAAMVDMQLMRDTETVPVTEIVRLGQHISTLAAVHDILTHQSKADGEAHTVPAASMLGRLLPLLQQSAGTHTVESHIEDVELTARQATSLALVASELVSNAIKHGKSKVKVEFRVTSDQAVLRVSDDGKGFPPDFNAGKAANTGLELVENLTQWDLGGRAEFGNRPEGGGRVEVVIPLKA
jgi:two-component system, sensor histidine kinase PdtaS